MVYKKYILLLKGRSRGTLSLEIEEKLKYSFSCPFMPEGADILLFFDENTFIRLPGTEGIASVNDADKVRAAALVKDQMFLMTGERQPFQWTRAETSFTWKNTPKTAAPGTNAVNANTYIPIPQNPPEVVAAAFADGADKRSAEPLPARNKPIFLMPEPVTVLEEQADLCTSFEKMAASPIETTPEEMDAPAGKEASEEMGESVNPLEAPPTFTAAFLGKTLPGLVVDASQEKEQENAERSFAPSFRGREAIHVVRTKEAEEKSEDVKEVSRPAKNIFGSGTCILPEEQVISPFSYLFGESVWRKVEYPYLKGRKHYLIGEIYHKGELSTIALAVPGEYALTPPPWLKGFNTYLNSEDGFGGYWVYMRNAATGNAATIREVLNRSQ